jgi:t-SNARE complex subunit (syntaxin)
MIFPYICYFSLTPGTFIGMAKKLKKISKKDIRNQVTEKLGISLKNYKVGNSKKKFRRTIKKLVKIITPLAVKTAKKLGHK